MNNISIYQLLNELLDTLQDYPLMVLVICLVIVLSLLLLVALYNDFKSYLDKKKEIGVSMKKKKLKKIQRLKKIRNIEQRRGKSKNQQEWIVVADSVIGKGHIEAVPSLPCQDFSVVKHLNEKWGIAVVADGLGSKPKSHVGSKFVSQRIVSHFEEAICNKRWFKKNKIPSFEIWDKMAFEALFKTYSDVVMFAEKNDYEVSHLATTVIAVVFSPFGLLITHMGDGRAGYRGIDGEWKAMLLPINGEEATQVMPITAPIWQSVQSVKPYIESRVIDEPIEAFTLMSDGCETFCYQTQIWNKEKNMCDNINLPYKGFFNPVVEKLKYFVQNKMYKEEIDAIWTKFLEEGNQKIKDELDDKTLIVGVFVK